ncbi:metallophosphoesterase [Bianquea renquensis]|uniref:Metallophosphoesterase n=1 Tax=Bianquea renquensis TaxID=2763661 RepID=A0A926I3D0_9FIRM|nr:metallophosphoesterase [Bianquea renquensis]MBC8545210.1 metallophosphoesterase [Bianquea renquensis]
MNIKLILWPATRAVREIATRLISLWNRLPGAGTLETDAYALTSQKLPAAFHGLRIVQLTDLHGRSFGEKQKTLLDYVSHLHPDIVVLTGDLIAEKYDGQERKAVQDLLQGLAQRYPVYAILGNHESRSRKKNAVIADCEKAGIVLLRNKGAYLWRRGVCIGLAGMETVNPSPADTALSTKIEEHAALQETLSRYQHEKKPAFQILLAHKPELLQTYAEYGVDLILAGHAHGGLMKIPFSGGKCVLAPGQGFFPRYTHGIYQEKNTLMVLGRGLGGPRIGIRPEVVCIDLYAEKKAKG